MATLSQDITVRSALNTRTLLWLVAFGILASLLALLTKAIMDNPTPSQDIRVMDWMIGFCLVVLGLVFCVGVWAIWQMVTRGWTW